MQSHTEHVRIYQNAGVVFGYQEPYFAKTCLDDSIERTSRGWGQGGLKGLGNILLARIESVVSIIMVGFASTMFGVCSLVGTPIAVLCIGAINLTSLIPVISSMKKVQNFVNGSNDILKRLLQVNWIGVRVILLFQTEACLSIIPGIVDKNNYFEQKIAEIVKPLGPLKTVYAKIPEGKFHTGTREKLSVLSSAEEFVRVFSKENKASKIIVQGMLHIVYEYQVAT